MSLGFDEPSFGQRARELADAIHAGPREIGAGKMADRLLDLADQIDRDARDLLTRPSGMTREEYVHIESRVYRYLYRYLGPMDEEAAHRQGEIAAVLAERAGVTWSTVARGPGGAVEPRQGGEQG